MSCRFLRWLGHAPGKKLAGQCWLSPLLIRILLLNVLPLVLLAVMLLYLNQFQSSLLETDVKALREQAHIYAGALGQSAVRRAPHGGPVLDAALARPLLVRLTESSLNAHARLFDPDGKLITDSRTPDDPEQKTGGKAVDVPSAVARENEEAVWHPPRNNRLEVFYDWLLSLLPLTSSEGIVPFDTMNGEEDGPRSLKTVPAHAELPPYIRRTVGHQLVITVVEPVIHDGETVGEIQLARHAPEIDRSLFSVRSSILSLVLLALVVTVLLSWYLSLTIAHPLQILARVSRRTEASSHGERADLVPQYLLSRRDEIGGLARALRSSTLALWARMDEIERFAADVSHEIKNPLSSIRSAIETLPRIRDLAARDRLLAIISADVKRLDRLITDISDASRVDAELSRVRHEPVAVLPLLQALVDIHQTTRSADDTVLRLDVADRNAALSVLAVEDRLVQVLRNLIGNAISFSPPCGVITLQARARDGEDCSVAEKTEKMVEITISDQGPGIPSGKLETIFERFYSERPQSEHFGQHSGLGLAISRQIIQALCGSLFAENIIEEGTGRVCGARFVICLPRVL